MDAPGAARVVHAVTISDEVVAERFADECVDERLGDRLDRELDGGVARHADAVTDFGCG